MKYVVQRNVDTRKLGRKKLVIEGYELKPHLSKRTELISVSQILVVSPSLHEVVLKKQFKNAYQKVFKKVMVVIEDVDSTSGDVQIVLGEVAKMKQILKEKYKQEVSKNEYRKMWRKVTLLEEELMKKQVLQKNLEQMISMMESSFYEEERGKSR